MKRNTYALIASFSTCVTGALLADFGPPVTGATLLVLGIVWFMTTVLGEIVVTLADKEDL